MRIVPAARISAPGNAMSPLPMQAIPLQLQLVLHEISSSPWT